MQSPGAAPEVACLEANSQPPLLLQNLTTHQFRCNDI